MRLSALASSEVLVADRADTDVDDVSEVIELGAILDAEFWKGNAPDAVCCRRRSAVRSKIKKICQQYMVFSKVFVKKGCMLSRLGRAAARVHATLPSPF